MTGQELYEQICTTLEARPKVGRKHKGRIDSGLRSRGIVFAMLQGGCLMVKLPTERVDELVSAGKGRPHIQGGKVSKQWLVVDLKAAETWLPLAEEAIERLEPEA